MSTVNSTISHTSTQPNVTAKQIPLATRQKIGVWALAGKESVSELARQHSTSRKFIYAQKDKISNAVEKAFSAPQDDSDVLFWIPVTKDWLRQVVLALILICHSSYSGVIEFFRDILGQNLCKGTIFNIVQVALQQAKEINRAQDLSGIKVGTHDEIFQGRTPVLVGCDPESTYTYLLKQEEHRDSSTWGVRLLELNDQGMKLDFTITDAGKGIRCGQQEAWPDVPCRGDVFHPLHDMGKLVKYVENRAALAVQTVESLEKKINGAKKKNKGTKYSRWLGHAREASTTAVQLRDDISILHSWLQNDILAVTGPDLTTRQEMLAFIIEELGAREPQFEHRIRPIRRLLETQGEDLLRFVEFLDLELQDLADAQGMDLYWVRQVFELQSIPATKNRYWEQAGALKKKMGARFYHVEKAVQELIEDTMRASSMVENLNSRLRNYFFLRKVLGNDYLELLQFFLNHRRFMRSMRPKRVGKSPTELLTGESHDHWLELLGHSMFKQSDQQQCKADQTEQTA